MRKPVEHWLATRHMQIALVANTYKELNVVPDYRPFMLMAIRFHIKDLHVLTEYLTSVHTNNESVITVGGVNTVSGPRIYDLDSYYISEKRVNYVDDDCNICLSNKCRGRNVFKK